MGGFGQLGLQDRRGRKGEHKSGRRQSGAESMQALMELKRGLKATASKATYGARRGDRGKVRVSPTYRDCRPSPSTPTVVKATGPRRHPGRWALMLVLSVLHSTHATKGSQALVRVLMAVGPVRALPGGEVPTSAVQGRRAQVLFIFEVFKLMAAVQNPSLVVLGMLDQRST
jgi:hypothetical protein